MRLPVKLALLLACAIGLPFALVALVLLPRGSAALQQQLKDLYAQDARALARDCERTVLDDLDALSLAARTLRLTELDDETRGQALLLLYNETRGADVIGLFDEKGKPVVPAVRFASLPAEASREHETVNDLAMVAYSHHVPLDAALETGLAIGPVYSLPDSTGASLPRVVLAARLPDRRWVLAMELSLRPVLRSVQAFRAGERGRAFLVDARNKAIAHSDSLLMRDRIDLSSHPLLAGRPSEMLGALAVAPVLGWKVVVEQPAEEGLRALRELLRNALAMLAVVLAAAIAVGMIAVRTVTRPVQRLRDAAQLVAHGSFDVDLHPSGNDELAELTRSFEAMVRGLKEREEMKLLVSLSSTLDLPQVLHKLLDALSTLVPFEKAAVLLMRTHGWEVALSRGYLDPDEPRVLCPVPGKDSLAARALREGKPTLSAQSNTLVVPLPSREGETAALVCLERRNSFEPPTAQLAFAFLKPAAVALDNARLFSEVKRLATIDGLTGVANRRHFLELGHRLFETARRYGQPLSALMIDVDRFKTVNDQYGHATGDQVLRTVAERCRQCLRSPDLLGRYGGEEFAVLLPMTQLGPAQNTLAERIRRIVSLEPIPTDTGPVTVTLSIGVATVSPGIASLEELLSKADAGLYEAKSAGRNRVA